LNDQLGQLYAQNGRGESAQGWVQPHNEQRGVVVLVHFCHAYEYLYGRYCGRSCGQPRLAWRGKRIAEDDEAP
jgi:hypothetical protein